MEPIYVTIAGLMFIVCLRIIVRSRYEARAKVARWEVHLRPTDRDESRTPKPVLPAVPTETCVGQHEASTDREV